MCDRVRSFTFADLITPKDNDVPPIRFEDLASGHIDEVLSILLPPPTLSREILHRACDHVPRVQIDLHGVVIAEPALGGTNAAESAAVSRARRDVWAAFELLQAFDDGEDGAKTGG